MSLISRIVSVFRTEHLNRELEEEQEFHIACREAVLFLLQTVSGRDFIPERRLRCIAQLLDWEQQRQAFRALLAGSATVT